MALARKGVRDSRRTRGLVLARAPAQDARGIRPSAPGAGNHAAGMARGMEVLAAAKAAGGKQGRARGRTPLGRRVLTSERLRAEIDIRHPARGRRAGQHHRRRRRTGVRSRTNAAAARSAPGELIIIDIFPRDAAHRLLRRPDAHGRQRPRHRRPTPSLGDRAGRPARNHRSHARRGRRQGASTKGRRNFSRTPAIPPRRATAGTSDFSTARATVSGWNCTKRRVSSSRAASKRARSSRLSRACISRDSAACGSRMW